MHMANGNGVHMAIVCSQQPAAMAILLAAAAIALRHECRPYCTGQVGRTALHERIVGAPTLEREKTPRSGA